MPELMLAATVAEDRFEQVLAELLHKEENGTPLDRPFASRWETRIETDKNKNELG